MNEGIRVAHFSLCHWHERSKNIYFDLESRGLFNLADCSYAWMHLFFFFNLTRKHRNTTAVLLRLPRGSRARRRFERV